MMTAKCLAQCQVPERFLTEALVSPLSLCCGILLLFGNNKVSSMNSMHVRTGLFLMGSLSSGKPSVLASESKTFKFTLISCQHCQF